MLTAPDELACMFDKGMFEKHDNIHYKCSPKHVNRSILASTCGELMETTIADSDVTFALNSRPEHADSAGVDGRLHVEASGEVGHILAPVADGECVGAGVQGGVGDGVGPVAVVLNVDLRFGAAVRDDLDGQLGGPRIGAVHDKLPRLPDLGALQAGAGTTHLEARR